jgi:CubicO group peptidase (beta-lactamase class C family)
LLTAASLPGADSSLDRRSRVENGILPLLVEKGRAGQTVSLTERMAEQKVAGLSMAVVHNGRIDWASGYGVTEKDGENQVTNETLFLAGSVSKPVAAVGALALVQQGRLTLDGDVNKGLVSWKVPPTEVLGDELVTLRRLLTHTAGLTVHGFPGYAEGNALPTVPQILDGEKPANTEAVRVDLAPDTQWRYSGGGYTVLQLLVSNVTGVPFAELMQELVLAPLGMSSSTYANPLPTEHHASASTAHWVTGTPVKGKWHTYPEMAAAGLWSTPSDLARFVIAIQDAFQGRSETVLTQEMTKEQLSKGLGDWGLGLALRGDGENTRFGHGGRDAGFDTLLEGYVRRGDGVVIMLNGNNDTGFATEIAQAVARQYSWPDYPQSGQREFITLPAEELEAYVGQYKGDDLEVKVRVSGPHLYAYPQGQGRLELLAESADIFFVPYRGDRVTFERNEDGDVETALLERRGETLRADRVP